MKDPKVSVIVPVYNTADYVEAALESVMNQTLKEIEIIAINDGSTDRSLSVIETVGQRDNRISIVSRENRGTAATRNQGVSVATGKYIYFMDSDDLLAENALEECYKRCEAEQLDFVFFNAGIIQEEDESIFSMNYEHFGIDDKVHRGIDLLNYMFDTEQYRVNVFLNFISHSYIKRIHLEYCLGMHEDQHYTTTLYMLATRVGYIPESFFKRRIRKDSVMTSRITWKNAEGYLISIAQLKKEIEGKGTEYQKTYQRYISITLNAFIYNARIMSLKERLTFMKICIRKGYFTQLKLRNIIIFLLPAVRKLKKTN